MTVYNMFETQKSVRQINNNWSPEQSRADITEGEGQRGVSPSSRSKRCTTVVLRCSAHFWQSPHTP